MTARQSTIMTVKQIASEIGCSMQTVRTRISGAAEKIPMIRIGKSAVYMREDFRKIEALVCDTAPARGRAASTKQELRFKHHEALRLRKDNVTYRRIADLLGYKTESGAWRAIKIEEKRKLTRAVSVFDKSL